MVQEKVPTLAREYEQKNSWTTHKQAIKSNETRVVDNPHVSKNNLNVSHLGVKLPLSFQKLLGCVKKLLRLGYLSFLYDKNYTKKYLWTFSFSSLWKRRDATYYWKEHNKESKQTKQYGIK